MRVLLIKPKQIGDSLILTPTIRAIRQAHPGAEIWVVIRRGCEGILAGCPDITRLLTVAPVEKRDRRFLRDLRNDLSTILQITTHRFDYAFELGDGGRGRNLIRLAAAHKRYSVQPSDEWARRGAQKAGCQISTFNWQTCHRVEKDFRTVSEFLPLPEPIGPMIFERAAMREWTPALSLSDFAVLQIGTRQGFNRWHRDGWREAGAALLERFPGLVISCGPAADERAEAAWLGQKLGPQALVTNGDTTWPQMAWLLARARLYVGPNTAAMHLAAAVGCPVVALFGPSIEDHWHPWRVPYRIVTTPGYVAATDANERYARVKQRTMQEIRAPDVTAACDELLREIAVTPRS